MTIVQERIDSLLATLRISCSRIAHSPMYTVDDAVGLKLGAGIKTLIGRSGEEVIVITIKDDERLNQKLLKSEFGIKRFQFLNEHELLTIVGVKRGAAAPFGYEPNVRLLISENIFDLNRVDFNPGNNELTYQLMGTDLRIIAHRVGAAIFKNYS